MMKIAFQSFEIFTGSGGGGAFQFYLVYDKNLATTLSARAGFWSNRIEVAQKLVELFEKRFPKTELVTPTVPTHAKVRLYWVKGNARYKKHTDLWPASFKWLHCVKLTVPLTPLHASSCRIEVALFARTKNENSL